MLSSKNNNISHSSVDIVGRSCRLPGANNVREFWHLLTNGQCSVTQMDTERFSMFRYKNPRRGEKGKAYSFAAGILEDVWGFDPAVFGILPREALQMDPQQRLLLMLVWEALEDAGLPPSRLKKRNVGVYVGNSGTEHSHRFFFDPAGSDSYMMTGNTGALLSNRVSYIFDLHGPSKTIDTACSSSLVALDEAVSALRAGQIDTAIVAGVNIMFSPFSFVGFSAATMLSPKGLCKAFDEDAYGYVRAEGGVVLILQRADEKKLKAHRCHARIVETGVNSDGRTVGVALPSAEFQGELLKQVYGRAGVKPDDLAFIEAHGTGTRVGDPAEAQALGSVLGQPRGQPLPIGSVKTNIGHLEPASGIVGLLKAMLALEHDLLPASLHFETPNPDILFGELNIKVNDQPRKLARGKRARFAGVSNFGFGGTNVHVILTDPPKSPEAVAEKQTGARKAKPRQEADQKHDMLLLSADSRGALEELACQYANRLEPNRLEKSLAAGDEDESGHDFRQLANAVAYRRERMAERLIVLGDDAGDMARGLYAFAAGEKIGNVISGQALSDRLETALVYSGNGSQWAGMGRDALARNEMFAASFRRVDKLFVELADWSLEEMLHAQDLEDQLHSTVIAQPLLFAIQVALTDALVSMGLKISSVLGHSVGEVAAGWASGALSLEQAVRIIHARSHHQEDVRGKGLMAAVLACREDVQAEIERHEEFDGLEISAINSPRSVTISGPTQMIKQFERFCERANWVCTVLVVDYPFHSRIIDPIRDDLIEDLQGLEPGKRKHRLYSTVTGSLIAGSRLTAEYWWKNVREPVRFQEAVGAAAADGCRLFVEIGPKPVLRGYLREITNDLEKTSCAFVHSLAGAKDGQGKKSRQDNADQAENDAGQKIDPVRAAFARAVAAGADFDEVAVFGPDQGADIELPLYPWQLTPYRLEPSVEAVEAFLLKVPPHRFLGQQLRPDQYVWTNDLDSGIIPFLEDHKVDGKAIMPGAGFAEMALAAAAQWLGSKQVELRDMDIVAPLMLGGDHSVQVQTRLSVESGTVEIASRQRLADDNWLTHIKCRVARIPASDIEKNAKNQMAGSSAPESHVADSPAPVQRLYRLARQHGIDFGPRFQRMVRCEEPEENIIEVVLDERDSALDAADGEASPCLLHPLDLDACFHGLNILYDKLDLGNDRLAFIPIRLGVLRLYLPDTAVRTCHINIRRANRRGGQADFELFDEQGRLVASLHDARFRAAALVPRHVLARTAYSFTHKLAHLPAAVWQTSAPDLENVILAANEASAGQDFTRLDEQCILLDAIARRVAYDIVRYLAEKLKDKSQSRNKDASFLLSVVRELAVKEQGKASAGKREITHHQSVIAALLWIAEQSGFAEQLASKGGDAKDNGVGGGDDEWQVSSDCPLPPCRDLIEGLLAEEPRWIAECTLLNRAAHLLPEWLEGAGSIAEESVKKGLERDITAYDLYSSSLLEQMAGASPLASQHVEKIAQMLETILRDWPLGKPLRVLELGTGGGALSRKLLPMIAARHGHLVVADSNRITLKRLAMQFETSPFFKTVSISDGTASEGSEHASEEALLVDEGPFDLLVSANGLHMLAHADEVVLQAVERLAPGGLLVVSENQPDAFHDIVFGQTHGWFEGSPDPYFPVNPMRDAGGWQKFFSSCGFDRVETLPLAPGLSGASLIMASRQKKQVAADEKPEDASRVVNGRVVNGKVVNGIEQPDPDIVRRIMIAATTSSVEMDFVEELSAELVAGGIGRDCIEILPNYKAQNDNDNDSEKGAGQWSSLIEAVSASRAQEVVDIVHLTGAFGKDTDSQEELGARMQSLTDLLQALGNRKVRLWIVAPGGARALLGAGAPSPVQCGIWAYGRTASNEYGDIDIRLVDFAGDLKNREQVGRLAALLVQPGDQSEVVLTKEAMLSLRARRGLPSAAELAGGQMETLQPNKKPDRDTSPDRGTSIVLANESGGTLDSIRWQRQKRRAPDEMEVEIEVGATGLNFRDVMWAQGLLPEEALENGFAGPTLGFECSGIVKRLGKNIEKTGELAVGDPVMALAPACFASHVTVDAKAVIKLPDNMDLQAGATIPVTFLTAYYSLHHLARLQQGEWVLVHGGAGGVGLAALQIAKWCGARVIATAGNDEKRQLLLALGADHVLNSRTLDFVDQVQRITRNDSPDGGVDVVLNSLAGEAMERSLELLRPFGRFLELGKRDFYGNTKIGLRPLRNNISYYGIDADQLLGHQPDLCKRLFGELTELFENEQFHPLPYRLFGSDEVVEAFRLMQQSGHIGKIVIKAPAPEGQQQTADHAALSFDGEFAASSDGAHIIIGGLGGFGLATALWLADSGATSIILTSRTGKLNDEARDILAELEGRGVSVDVEVCDATSEKDVDDLLRRTRAKRPIKGVMHAAMVLEDVLIPNLRPHQIDRVLRPKVIGADILDRLTRVDQLDYFVLFSSVAAMFGNPGQANYVAANAYMEGIALRRRQEGLPAIAVGWGAITDVGVLTRDTDTAEHLARHTGGVEFKARSGLDLLGRLLAADEQTPAPGVVTLATMDWSFASDILPALKRSTFGILAREAAGASGKKSQRVNIRELVAGLGEMEARDKIAGLLAEEVATITRMPLEAIHVNRSLADMGVESMMGAELRIAAKLRTGMEIPIVSVADGTTINDIAAKMLARVRGGDNSEDEKLADVGERMAVEHLGDDHDQERLEDLRKTLEAKQDEEGQVSRI